MSTTVTFLLTLLSTVISLIGGISTSSTVGTALYLCLYMMITDLMVFWILFLLNQNLIVRKLAKGKITKA